MQQHLRRWMLLKQNEKAFAVNRDGAANLADICAEKQIPLIHISTDYVYDGTKNDPYLESDLVSPQGVYAKSKAQGDAAVAERLIDAHHLENSLGLQCSWAQFCQDHAAFVSGEANGIGCG